MARKAFFSFHYKNDVVRANQVRNSWVTKRNSESAGFVDAAEFENVQKGGEAAVKKWINDQLVGTSVTVVLIGSETNQRDYVKYELQQSYAKGNGLLGIYIHSCKELQCALIVCCSSFFLTAPEQAPFQATGRKPDLVRVNRRLKLKT